MSSIPRQQRLGAAAIDHDTALQHHQAGRLSEAEKLYRQILASTPGHAEARENTAMVGLLMLLHAPRNTAKPAAIPRLTTVRMLLELIMASPPKAKSLTASVPQPSAKLLSEQ